MQRASGIGQHNHEHVQAKGRFTTRLSGPTRWPITLAPVLLFGKNTMQYVLNELLSTVSCVGVLLCVLQCVWAIGLLFFVQLVMLSQFQVCNI